MNWTPAKGDNRTLGQIREHYEIEKELASKLRTAKKSERGRLYSSLYDELYRRVAPHHPQVNRRHSEAAIKRAVDSQMHFLKHFLEKDMVFLEVGPGDCMLTFEVARRVKKSYAIDVSAEISKNSKAPKNFNLIISDGTSVPVPAQSVDIAYSHQFMEHLHPDDAFEQVKNMYACLAPGGKYVCITPNRLNGPHDISKYFDRVATCFHLKEYTTAELAAIFRKAGFSRVRIYIGVKSFYFKVPLALIGLYEGLLSVLPYGIRKIFVCKLPSRVLLGGIRMVGYK